MVARTEILPDEGRHRQRDRRDGQEREGIDLVIRRPASHAVRAEAVDIGLHKNIGKRRDRQLHRRRQAQRADAAEHVLLQPHRPPLDAVIALRPCQHRQHQRRRGELRKDRRDRHTRDAHMKYRHEQQIEDRVRHRREDQEIQRPSGVADGAQDARAHVVQQQPAQSGKIDLQILARMRKHLLRRLHHPQQRGRQHHAERAQRDAHQDRHGDGRLHGGPDVLPLPRAVMPRDDDARAGRKAVEEADEHIDHRPDAPDRGQRLLADEISDHHAVHRVVQLLKNVADQKRDGKRDQLPEDAASGHVGVRPPQTRLQNDHHQLSLFRGRAQARRSVCILTQLRRRGQVRAALFSAKLREKQKGCCIAVALML